MADPERCPLYNSTALVDSHPLNLISYFSLMSWIYPQVKKNRTNIKCAYTCWICIEILYISFNTVWFLYCVSTWPNQCLCIQRCIICNHYNVVLEIFVFQGQLSGLPYLHDGGVPFTLLPNHYLHDGGVNFTLLPNHYLHDGVIQPLSIWRSYPTIIYMTEELLSLYYPTIIYMTEELLSLYYPTIIYMTEELLSLHYQTIIYNLITGVTQGYDLSRALSLFLLFSLDLVFCGELSAASSCNINK